MSLRDTADKRWLRAAQERRENPVVTGVLTAGLIVLWYVATILVFCL